MTTCSKVAWLGAALALWLVAAEHRAAPVYVEPIAPLIESDEEELECAPQVCTWPDTELAFTTQAGIASVSRFENGHDERHA